MKVKGHPDLRRTKGGAIVNVNHDALTKKRMLKRRQEQKDQELEDLKDEVAELRQLVGKLIDGR